MFKRKPNFVSPKSYKLASKAKRKQICNGCGPKGYDWFVPDHLLGINITECCNIHDWMYNHGTTESDRCWADSLFLINMRIAIRFPKHTWEQLRACRFKFAIFYYNMVRQHGKGVFNDSIS